MGPSPSRGCPCIRICSPLEHLAGAPWTWSGVLHVPRSAARHGAQSNYPVKMTGQFHCGFGQE
eukprot:245586-Pyramimonas_sp.AAC.1